MFQGPDSGRAVPLKLWLVHVVNGCMSEVLKGRTSLAQWVVVLDVSWLVLRVIAGGTNVRRVPLLALEELVLFRGDFHGFGIVLGNIGIASEFGRDLSCIELCFGVVAQLHGVVEFLASSK